MKTKKNLIFLTKDYNNQFRYITKDVTTLSKYDLVKNFKKTKERFRVLFNEINKRDIDIAVELGKYKNGKPIQ